MKKSILRRIKWGNVSLLLATGAVAVAGAWGYTIANLYSTTAKYFQVM